MERRKILQAIGVSSALSASIGTASAKDSDGDDFKQDMRHALKIGHSRGKEAREKFFEENGYSYTSKTIEKSISLGSDDSQTEDEVSTEAINDPKDGGIRVTIGATEGRDPPESADLFAWVSVDYKFSATCAGQEFIGDSSGEDPKDALGIAWNSRQNEYFRLADDGGESAMEAIGSNVSWYEDMHEPVVGRTVFRFNDSDSYSDWVSDNVDNTDCGLLNAGEKVVGPYPGGTCGVYLTTYGDHDPDERVVRASYTHAHATVDVATSLSFTSSGPGIEVTPEYRTDYDRIATDPDGDDLEVYQSELISF
ncbi:hypothetical protein RBH26_00940 [Natronolimnohabitans sp. A-GB9]|uniref:hypothetical protein n=1 Tax=Natronolimnohabitans sp. A-GB9 TaxID=3069757 RepID=UPI0027B0C5F9|nr:hypothetical protein [Natronolimnohabitans sp. A-GB9]MDQ2049042.1 hypothetical protein [Natronolimnohabitans sp. A-GB9]